MTNKSHGSSARGKPARKNALHVPDSRIDFSDIPELTNEELSLAVRRGRGRPPEGNTAKQLIALRIDPDLFGRIRAVAAEKAFRTERSSTEFFSGR